MSLNLDFKATDNNGNTALHIATRNGNTKMAFKVLLKNPDFKSKNKKGLSAFDMAKTYEFDNIEGLFVSPLGSSLSVPSSIQLCFYSNSIGDQVCGEIYFEHSTVSGPLGFKVQGHFHDNILDP